MTRPLLRAVLAVPLVLAVVGLAGCSYSGDHSQQVTEWVNQNSFKSNEANVIEDATRVQLAVKEGTAKELRTVCGGLSADSGTLYSSLRTPDETLTHELAASMEDFFRASTLCSVASSTSAPTIAPALSDIRRGLVELAVARQRLSQFGVRSQPVPAE